LLPCLSWFQRTCALYLEIQRCNQKPWSQTCLVQWRISCELGGDTNSPARQRGRSDELPNKVKIWNIFTKQDHHCIWRFEWTSVLLKMHWTTNCWFHYISYRI
jgi:hypothetical protein